MNYKVMTIAALNNPDAGAEELNSFLNSHKIVSVDKKCCQTEQGIFWTFAIVYQGTDSPTGGTKKSGIDYKEELPDEEFQRYAQLRKLRNNLASEIDKPPYAIFTNEQLAKMVTEKITTQGEMAKISGIGKGRLKMYADKFLPLLVQLHAGGSHKKAGGHEKAKGTP